MPDLTITIAGVRRNTPSWETIERLIRDTLAEDWGPDREFGGKLTSISRVDGGCGYREPGQYELTFTPDSGDDFTIHLDMSRGHAPSKRSTN